MGPEGRQNVVPGFFLSNPREKINSQRIHHSCNGELLPKGERRIRYCGVVDIAVQQLLVQSLRFVFVRCSTPEKTEVQWPLETGHCNDNPRIEIRKTEKTGKTGYTPKKERKMLCCSIDLRRTRVKCRHHECYIFLGDAAGHVREGARFVHLAVVAVVSEEFSVQHREGGKSLILF